MLDLAAFLGLRLHGTAPTRPAELVRVVRVVLDHGFAVAPVRDFADTSIRVGDGRSLVGLIMVGSDHVDLEHTRRRPQTWLSGDARAAASLLTTPRVRR